MCSQRPKQLLPTDLSYNTVLKFVKLCILLIQKSSDKQYAKFTTLAMVWALCSFRMFFCAELCCRLEIDFISLSLCFVGLTNSYSKITNKYQLEQKI